MTGSDFSEVLSKENILENVPLSGYTTFRVGGNARLFLIPQCREELLNILKLLRDHDEDYFLLGRGSNLIVSDRGYDGVVIYLRNLKNISVEGNLVTAECGAMMADIAQKALLNELRGFEFASGIPGTIGGGIRMNAGAYGGELKDIVREAEVLCPDGEIRWMTPRDLEMGYRTSLVFEKGYTVLTVVIELQKGNPEEIKALMNDLNQRRRDKQPLEYGSCGSTFKRPEGYFAGALIEQAGLKGYHVGDACVSEKHAGFVVNKGNCTADEILQVIHHVQKVVMEKFGVQLVSEDVFLGEF